MYSGDSSAGPASGEAGADPRSGQPGREPGTARDAQLERSLGRTRADGPDTDQVPDIPAPEPAKSRRSGDPPPIRGRDRGKASYLLLFRRAQGRGPGGALARACGPPAPGALEAPQRALKRARGASAAGQRTDGPGRAAGTGAAGEASTPRDPGHPALRGRLLRPPGTPAAPRGRRGTPALRGLHELLEIDLVGRRPVQVAITGSRQVHQRLLNANRQPSGQRPVIRNSRRARTPDQIIR